MQGNGADEGDALEGAALREGEYVGVRRFTRILERGDAAKATVDALSGCLRRSLESTDGYCGCTVPPGVFFASSGAATPNLVHGLFSVQLSTVPVNDALAIYRYFAMLGRPKRLGSAVVCLTT